MLWGFFLCNWKDSIISCYHYHIFTFFTCFRDFQVKWTLETNTHMTGSVKRVWSVNADDEKGNKPHTTKLQQVEEDDGAGDEQGLTWLDAVDACKDVDGICAEHCKHSHVDVVEDTCRRSLNHIIYRMTEHECNSTLSRNKFMHVLLYVLLVAPSCKWVKTAPTKITPEGLYIARGAGGCD